MTAKIRKYILPNLPYLLVFVVLLEARHRLPPRGRVRGLRHKVHGTIRTLGPALKDIAPGLGAVRLALWALPGPGCCVCSSSTG